MGITDVKSITDESDYITARVTKSIAYKKQWKE